MDQVIVAAMIEAAKLGLQVYFLNAQTAGLTPEQIEAFYKLERNKFLANHPDSIPEVPK